MGKIHKLKAYAFLGSVNLFGTDSIVLFNLWELPINSFCNKVDVIENYKLKQTERFIMDLKNEFPRIFSEGLGLCTKTVVKFELKEMWSQSLEQRKKYHFWH